MAYQINVTDHLNGNVSVTVINTAADRFGGAAIPRIIFERHQYSDIDAAYKQASTALRHYMKVNPHHSVYTFSPESAP